MSSADPGLVRIDADDRHMSAGAARHLDPEAIEEITSLRKVIWHTENRVAGPDGDIHSASAVRELKMRLMGLTVELRERCVSMPPGYETWWRDWESHAWPTPVFSPWDARSFGDGGVLPAETVPRPANGAAAEGVRVPATMSCGQRHEVDIIMRNCGSPLAWRRGGTYPYRLGSVDAPGVRTWGVGRVPLPRGMVWPGEAATFAFSVTAPETPGIYPFQWRMMQEGWEWFGPPTEPFLVQVGPTVDRDPDSLTSHSVTGGVRHFIRPSERPPVSDI